MEMTTYIYKVKCYEPFVTQMKNVKPDNYALSGPISVLSGPYVHKLSVRWCHKEEALRIFPLLPLVRN
jgi:hypothetical protein